jgi:hypothetical protein
VGNLIKGEDYFGLRLGLGSFCSETFYENLIGSFISISLTLRRQVRKAMLRRNMPGIIALTYAIVNAALMFFF